MRSEMLPISENNQNIKMFGVPPNTFALGYVHVHNDNLPLGNIAFKTIAGRSDGVFWWFPALSEDQQKKSWIHQNYLVALMCVFFSSFFLYVFSVLYVRYFSSV